MLYTKISNNSNDEIKEINRELNIENLSENILLNQKDDKQIEDLFDNPKNPFKNYSKFSIRILKLNTI